MIIISSVFKDKQYYFLVVPNEEYISHFYVSQHVALLWLSTVIIKNNNISQA